MFPLLKKVFLFICLVLITIQLHAQAQNQNTLEKKIYLELRPLQFILDGYSFVGHYAFNDRMQIGGSVFAAKLSEGITDFVWDTQGSLDLEAKQDLVFGLSYRYFLKAHNSHKGWFLGAAVGAEFYTLTNQQDNQKLDYTFYYLAPRLGYIWHPLKKKIPNLFIAVEGVVVFPLINDGRVTFDSEGSTEINNILPSPLIGIGYRF